MTLSGTLLRASAIEMMGSGKGSVADRDIFACIGKLMAAASIIGFDFATMALPLSRIPDAWSTSDTAKRIVLVPTG